MSSLSGEVEFIENTVSTKHLKLILNSEEKTIIVLGNNKEQHFKIDSKLDYEIFKNHKAKIYIDKDNVYNKGIIEKLDNKLFSYRVELIEKENDDEISESEEKNQIDFDVIQAIKQNIKTDYQKKVFNDIYNEAILNLKD